tara:strand:- start:6040 stop:6861 length:822 start_codon:yes stop_codon:yes gene_type:complete
MWVMTYVKMLLACLFMSFSCVSLSQVADSSVQRQNHQARFVAGEVLTFKLNYGWFTIGEAFLNISEKLFQNKSSYHLEIKGGTAGFLEVFAKVDDRWGAYISKSNLLPMFSYSDIKEGKYTREDKTYFDQETHRIKVEKTKKGIKRPVTYFDYKGDMYDLMSGYLMLRNIDYSLLKIGDTVRFNAFYDDVFYDFGLVYEGTEILKTKVGKQRAHKVSPILPNNQVFTGNHPITAWISADENQLPLKIEAQMFFGTASCVLVAYKNVKYGPDYD